MTEHEKWLNLTREEAIDPTMPICDAHHHLRRLEANKYLTRDFLRDINDGHNVTQTVFIQSIVNLQKGPGGGMTPIEETEFVIADIASTKSRVDIAAAIVGFTDLTLGDAVAPILEAHITAGKKRFRGIRFNPMGLHDAVILPQAQSPFLAPDFKKGFACLGKFNLSYDVLLGRQHFTGLVTLAREFPDIPIIINHIGWSIGHDQKDQPRAEIFRYWQQNIDTLASCPNIYVKLGGLGMAISGFGWDKQPVPPSSEILAQEMAPYYLYCVEKFGVARCMFESNFPVDKESYSYTVMWNAFKRMTKDFTPAERSALFHDTAAKVYRI